MCIRDRSEPVDVSADINKLMQLYTVFKNAVEFYEDCRFWIDGKLLDTYRQDELQRESFAYNSIKPRDAKATSKFSHSTWENVSQFSPSICGWYIPLADVADGKPHKITIELTIPFTDQLALQAWQLYPNDICGEIEAEVKTSLRAMVWAQVNPNVVKETFQFLDDKAIDEEMPAVVPITRKFTQVGKPANIVVQYKAGEAPNENEEPDPNILKVNVSKDKVVNDKLTITAANGIDMKVGKITLNVLGGTIQLGRSNLSGFGLKPGVYQGLIRELQTALLVPSQELTREIFEGLSLIHISEPTRP